VVDIGIYEQPDTLRANLMVGPDGRINYLEARDIDASSLTVDELRAKIEGVLAKFRRSPRVIITPVSFTSKKYYVLGNVVQRGVFTLDRSVSVLEAIARARGFVTNLPPPLMTAGAVSVPAPQRSPLVQADFARSFLVRKGTDGAFSRMPVDFEGLLLRGELAHNVALEPDDYLFFPPPDLQEVYVLGAVRGPGMVPFSRDLTALGAIVARGGFTDRAWRQKVLVVRGSLTRPQPLVVDMAAILAAKAPDYPLNNRDIVFVHEKPWAKAQELLELAVMNFAAAFVNGVTYTKISPIITDPWVK
jgi:protein involved in polysaccharide export with SLBB domain